VRAFEVQEAYGLIWVRLEPSDSQLPVFAAETDEHLRKVNCGPYDVAASAPRIIENFLDMSHFGFVHEGWLGSRDATAIAAYKVETTSTGVLATGCKAVQPQSNLHSTQAAEVEYTYEVTAAYTAVLTKIPEEGTPSRAGASDRPVHLPCHSRNQPRLVPSGGRGLRIDRRAVADLPAHHLCAGPAGAGVAAAQGLPLDPRGNALGGRPHVVGLSPLPEGPGDRLRNLLRQACPAWRPCGSPGGRATGLRPQGRSRRPSGLAIWLELRRFDRLEIDGA
jgi:hypothetical protein